MTIITNVDHFQENGPSRGLTKELEKSGRTEEMIVEEEEVLEEVFFSDHCASAPTARPVPSGALFFSDHGASAPTVRPVPSGALFSDHCVSRCAPTL